MLEHLGETQAAAKIENAVSSIIAEGKDVTYDLGGTAGTKEYADAIIRRMVAGN
jgi:isocitrate dehydrogenase (NAD+)